jgi:hypothetical protein
MNKGALDAACPNIGNVSVKLRFQLFPDHQDDACEARMVRIEDRIVEQCLTMRSGGRELLATSEARGDPRGENDEREWLGQGRESRGRDLLPTSGAPSATARAPHPW